MNSRGQFGAKGEVVSRHTSQKKRMLVVTDNICCGDKRGCLSVLHKTKERRNKRRTKKKRRQRRRKEENRQREREKVKREKSKGHKKLSPPSSSLLFSSLHTLTTNKKRCALHHLCSRHTRSGALCITCVERRGIKWGIQQWARATRCALHITWVK